MDRILRYVVATVPSRWNQKQDVSMYVSFGKGPAYSVPIRWGLFIAGPLP